jgi:uncharacterized protein YegL
LDFTIQAIKEFKANMITTRLDKPLKDALNINPSDEFIKKGNYKKLIFVLTDGEADDKVKCLSTV